MGWRIFLGAVLAGALCSLSGFAWAGEDDRRCSLRDPDKRAWSGAIQFDNDFFDLIAENTDRYYTHGTHVACMSPAYRCSSLIDLGPKGTLLEQGEHVSVHFGIAAGQDIYTPESLDFEQPPGGDRPYAGWLYAGPTFVTYSSGELNSLEVHVGVVGPSARADWVQNNWHDLIHTPRFRGWPDQLEDELAFVVVGERKWAPRPLRVWGGEPTGPRGIVLDRTHHASFAVGTVRTGLQAGTNLRLGWGLDGDFGPPSIQPAPSGALMFRGRDETSLYLFAGVEGRLVGRDIFLDGNTWQDSPRVDKRAAVYDAQAGIAGRWGPVRLAYIYIWRSEEFINQRDPQKFGSVTVGLTLNGAGFIRPSKADR